MEGTEVKAFEINRIGSAVANSHAAYFCLVGSSARTTLTIFFLNRRKGFASVLRFSFPALVRIFSIKGAVSFCFSFNVVSFPLLALNRSRLFRADTLACAWCPVTAALVAETHARRGVSRG
jgi:hypothetical protein